MNDAKRAGENAESKPLNLRLPHAVSDQLQALADSLPIVSNHRLAVEALRLGLAALAADPSILLRGASTPSTSSPAPSPAPAPSRPVVARVEAVEAPAVTLHNAANGASVATITGNDNAQEPTIPKPKRTRRAAPVEAPELVDVEAAHRRAAEVAERLRALRDAEAASGVLVGSRQWTIRPIAERAGMSGDPVAKLMRGEHVSPEMVDKLAAILPAE
mgnify:CR=1 FL=1